MSPLIQADHVGVIFREVSEAGKLTQDILDLDVQEKKSTITCGKSAGSLANASIMC